MARYDERTLALGGFFGLGSKPKYKIVVEVDGAVVKEVTAEGTEEADSKVKEYIGTAFDNGIVSRTRIKVVCTESNFTHFDGMLLAGFRLRDNLEPMAEPVAEPEEEPKPEPADEEEPKPEPVSEPQKPARHGKTNKEQWYAATAWARRKGLSLGKGYVGQDKMRIAIHDSGLWEEWNARYPEFAFDQNGYEYSLRKTRGVSA